MTVAAASTSDDGNRAVGLAHRIAQRCQWRSRYPADTQGERDWIADGGALVARDLLWPSNGHVGLGTDETRWQITDALLALPSVPGFGFPELSAIEAGIIADRIIAHLERDAIRSDGAPDEHDAEADAPRLHLMPRLTRAQMATNLLSFLCPSARFLPIGVETIITALGGFGKTRLILQVLYQLSLGQAVFGCELLRPPRPMRCLYIGAEDSQPFFNSAAIPLLGRDDESPPFDTILLPEVFPGFTLTPDNSRMLSRFIDGEFTAAGGLDCLALDPRVSLVPPEYADLMKNPIIARAFFNDCIAPILTGKPYALLSSAHDSKVASPVAGSADQQNAARCVLQITGPGPQPDGRLPLKVDRHKDNVGFRFKELALVRDADTLLLTWDEMASVYAYGAPAASKAFAKPPTDASELRRYFARQAAKLLQPTEAPPSRRQKRAIEDLLIGQAVKDGVPKAKAAVRSFLNGCCEFEELQEGRKRSLLLVGVRNPDAAIDEHGDFIAGRAATDPGVAE